ncbi:MAG TPA: DNA alkylation response protein, partial [Microbacterium sp.]|nr:DNA alkylation response protein [Microbacterium sp.]
MTHEVTNQAPPRVDVDEYGSNAPLTEAVRAFGAEWADAALRDAGRLTGSADFQTDAERANRHEPELRAHDRWGRRIDEVEYDPSYHRVIREAVARGAHTSAWAEPVPGSSVSR